MSLFYCKVLLLLLLVLLLLSFIFLLSFDHVKLKAYLEESIFRLFGQHCLPLPNKFDWIGKPEKVIMFCFCFCPFYLCMLVAFLTYLIQATTFLLLTHCFYHCVASLNYTVVHGYSGTVVSESTSLKWFCGFWLEFSSRGFCILCYILRISAQGYFWIHNITY